MRIRSPHDERRVSCGLVEVSVKCKRLGKSLSVLIFLAGAVFHKLFFSLLGFFLCCYLLWEKATISLLLLLIRNIALLNKMSLSEIEIIVVLKLLVSMQHNFRYLYFLSSLV